MAVCSIGPIISILVMGLVGGFSDIAYKPHPLPEFINSQQMGWSFISAIPSIVKDVLMGLLPILIFFLVYQFLTVRVNKKEMAQIFIGAGYTFTGMVLFLVGVNVGFMPVGSYLGATFANLSYSWIIVPIGMIIGFCMTYAEPAVGVLNKQVEEATSGTIPPKVLPMAMALGVAAAGGIAMIRALTGIPILPFLLIGYIAAVVLSFHCPGLFTSIAFDAGGVASGVMAATFLLPMSIGVCEAVGGNTESIMTDAFGVIALVAMMPPVTIQIVGMIYKIKLKNSAAAEEEKLDTTIIDEIYGFEAHQNQSNDATDDDDVLIIDFTEEESSMRSTHTHGGN